MVTERFFTMSTGDLTCLTQTTFDDLAQAHDQPGILKSRDYFNSLIKAEMSKGIPSERIVLGMFPYSFTIPILSVKSP